MTETEHHARRMRPLTIIGAALALGVVAGAAALYVKPQGSGNVAGGDDAVKCALDDTDTTSINSAAKGEVAAMLPAETPQSFSALAFNGPDGKPKVLKDLAGKTLLLNLWATWCVPCREEMPALNALQKSAGGDRFEVVAVNVDNGTDEKPRRFLGETGVDALTFYQDPTLGVFNDLKKRGLVLGLPATFIVRPDGCLLAAMNGPAKWDSADASALISSAVTLGGT